MAGIRVYELLLEDRLPVPQLAEAFIGSGPRPSAERSLLKAATPSGTNRAMTISDAHDHAPCWSQTDTVSRGAGDRSLMNASRSALMVSASVVGIPCGKPL